jgi:hypothetical protein
VSPARSRQEAAKEQRQKKRVDEAVKLCSEVLSDGWQETAASRATDYVSEQTWHALFRRRRTRHCRALADLAASVLTGKEKLHDLIGSLARWIAAFLGVGSVEQKLISELTSKLPLPWDSKMVAVARGIQVTGILLCLADGRELSRCQCFIELALTETKARVKHILVAAIEDWTHLAAFPPNTPASK